MDAYRHSSYGYRWLGADEYKVQYVGAYGDIGVLNTVSIPNPTFSPVYEFCIYFTNNVRRMPIHGSADGFNHSFGKWE